MRLLFALSLVLAAGCGSSSNSCGALGQRCCSGGSQCAAGLTCLGMLCYSSTADLAGVDFAGGGGGDMAHATPDLSSAPDGASPCSPGGTCASGPLCGDSCCNHGEYCDSSGINPQCSCGGGPACATGASCVSNIPVACGSVCCPPTCPP